MSRPHRLQLLDLCRGLGQASVVLFHVIGFYSGSLVLRLMPQQASILDFFFIASGFFASYSYARRPAKHRVTSIELIAARACRVYPMAILGTSIAFAGLILHLIHQGDTGQLGPAIYAYIFGCLLVPVHTSLTSFGVQNLFPLDSPLWFIFFDFLAYMLFAVLLRALPKKALGAIVVLAGIGFWRAALHHDNLYFSSYWSGASATMPRVIFDVAMGSLIFRFYRPDIRINRLFWFVPVSLLLFVMFVPIPAFSPYSGAFQAFSSTVLMPAALALAVRIEAPEILRWPASLGGRISMAVYALHLPIVAQLYALRWSLHLRGAEIVALLGAEFVLAIGVAYFVTVYLDEPLRALLSNTRRRYFAARFPHAPENRASASFP